MRFSFAPLFFIFIFVVTQNVMIANTFAQETLTFHGQLKNETAYRYVDPASFTKIYNLARLEARYIPSSSVQLTALVRSYYDAVYDFQEVDNVVEKKSADHTE
ncbi:MAG: hypothetical protein MPW14_07810 [Candidatus Manganitrophus sp.]|nr:MAG: hypothetical protein MPW14_07810 [Candidatus Manganitrophus sp.]